MEDIFYSLLGLAVIIVPIYLIVKIIKKKKNNNFNDNKQNKLNIKKEKKVKTLKLKDITHIEGISSLRAEEDCALYVDDEKLTIISKIGKFNISLDRIVNAGLITKSEMESKNKSVLGRALVGSAVGLGLIGALSGIGQKVKKKYSYFLVINYKDKNEDDIKLLVFGLGQYNGAGQLFADRLTKRLNNNKVDIDL